MNSGEISSSDCWTVPEEKVSDGKAGEGDECQRVWGVGSGVGRGVGSGVGIGVGSGVDGWHARGGFVWWLWVCGGGGGWQHVVVG